MSVQVHTGSVGIWCSAFGSRWEEWTTLLVGFTLGAAGATYLRQSRLMIPRSLSLFCGQVQTQLFLGPDPVAEG